MVTQPTPSIRLPHIPSVLRRWWQYNPVLTLLVITMLVSTIGGFIGLAVDPRLVVNAPTWAKTTKFSISVALYAATFLWMLPYFTDRPVFAKRVATAIGGILFFEMALIILQGFRGHAMHFNNANPLDATLFQIMGISISILWVLSMVGAFLILRQRIASPTLAWSLRLGFGIMVIGLGLGFLMTAPTSAQMEVLTAGQQVDFIGAHTIGAPDGGDGLPLLGWSTTHGDLRIAHFVGLHAFQAIPLLGWLLLQRREAWLKDNYKVVLVWIGAGGYLGLTLAMAWQALRGQSIVAPDGLTLMVFGLIVAVTVGVAAVVISRARAVGYRQKIST